MRFFIERGARSLEHSQRSCKLGFFVKIDVTVAKNTQKRIPTGHVK